MLTLRALMQFTPDAMKKRALKVGIRLIKSTIDKDDEGVFKKVELRAIATTIPRIVIFKIYMVKGNKFTINSPTWVHCSGENYLYQWEVANTMRGSSSIINSNGAMPRITNPRTRPGLCKHAYAAAPLALKAKVKITTDLPEDVERLTRKLSKVAIPKRKVKIKKKPLQKKDTIFRKRRK